MSRDESATMRPASAAVSSPSRVQSTRGVISRPFPRRHRKRYKRCPSLHPHREAENHQTGFRQLRTSVEAIGSGKRDAWPTQLWQLACCPRHHASVTESAPPPVPHESQPVWTDPSWGVELNIERQIFCNRSLTMNSIKAVGFDMDYTLAQYKAETFETLAFEETKKKLVTVMGYPRIVEDFTFDCYYIMRGLVVDKKRGNLLKVDRHKYVKVAYHGFQKLSQEERQSLYGRTETRDAFDEPDYTMIDTLFSISEAYLFMSLVELKESRPELLEGKSFIQMCNDVRFAVDYCHRDGTLKKKVAEDPGRYIHEDALLIPILEMLRRSGKALFIATNSLWDYTNVAMNFLLENKKGKECTTEWLKYFDVVVCGCGKPRFFNSKNALFIVDPETGHLLNTDNGAPMACLHGPEEIDNGLSLRSGDWKVFQGGNYIDLHRVLGITSGTEVLYVGDHIYGDILKSKKTLGWRTMLVVPELEQELKILSRSKEEHRHLLALRNRRNALEDEVHHLKWHLETTEAEQNGAGYSHLINHTSTAAPSILESLEAECRNTADEHRIGLKKYHEKFHPIWGRSSSPSIPQKRRHVCMIPVFRLLKTGHQSSLLAHQIDRFACLYTSHVGNLMFYSPNKRYRGRLDVMAHD